MTLGQVIHTGRRPPAPPKRKRAEVLAEWHLYERESAVNNWSTPCATGPEPYEEGIFDLTAEQVLALCTPCPLLALCGEYARVTKADGVIRGGQVWVDGKPFVQAPPVLV